MECGRYLEKSKSCDIFKSTILKNLKHRDILKTM